MAANLTPFEQAQCVARRLGMDFHRMLYDHLEHGYVYSSDECFICAVDCVREFGEYSEPGVFVTLAAGSLDHFISIDPLKDKRKWLGFCREEGGEVHWIPFSRLLKADHI